MAESAASTAFGPIMIAASDQSLPLEQRIFDDRLAYRMLPLYLRLMLKILGLGPVRRAFIHRLEKFAPGIFTSVLCRKRYIEDKAIESLRAGIDSLVILGAGLDTLAYRVPQFSSVRVYELDLPENSAYKRKKLEAVNGAVPANVSLLPIDFEGRHLEAVLRETGYAGDQPALFIWEGVTQYISEAAVRDTFRFLALAQPGSRLLFTYIVKQFLDGENAYGLEGMQRRLEKSRTWHFGLNPVEVAAFIGDYGWELVEQVGALELTQRYVLPAGRREPVAEIERIVYAQKRPSLN